MRVLGFCDNSFFGAYKIFGETVFDPEAFCHPAIALHPNILLPEAPKWERYYIEFPG